MSPTTGELRKLGAGVQLGRYTLLRRIAAGGMAEVYSARIEGISGFEKKVAIKKILPQFSMNRRFIDMIVDEAKIAVTLTHPNIAQVYELGLEGDTYYIVMEYVDGRPLNRLLQKVDIGGSENLELEHAVHIMAEVAKGLHHAHIQKDAQGNPLNIVHRDISPQNILLSYSGQVKVIDFGIARATGRLAQTSVGVIKGKLRYLAPEIARGEEPDARSDVYCCGIVLFELLTGEAMFAPRTDLEAIEMASKAIVRHPKQSNPAVPDDLDTIVMKALARDREERYQSAKDLYGDLRRFLNRHFPAYVGSELGDRMAQLFAAEVEEDRDLDAVAERIVSDVRRNRDASTAHGSSLSATPAPLERLPPPPPPAGGSNSYRQLVTRSIEIDPSTDSGATQTGETGDPHESATIAVDPSVVGPNAPDALYAADPRSLAGGQGATPLRRSMALVAGMFVGALAVVIAVFVGFRSAGPPTPSSTVEGATPIAPEPPPEPGGLHVSIPIEVQPKSLAVDVYLDGRLIQKAARAGVEVTLEVGTEHELRVETEGYEPSPSRSFVVPKEPSPLEFELRRLGKIVVTGNVEEVEAEGGELQADGRTIVAPIGQPVTVRVDRRKGSDVKETIILTDERPSYTYEVRNPRPSPPGTLKINTRPASKIWVDGKFVGWTPQTVKRSAGRHRVEVRSADGSIRRSKTVEIRSGRVVSVTGRLEDF